MPAQTIAIFGAGIAGLSAAHELARRGHQVQVYETRPEPGGFFRSARHPQHDQMPSEYSWHGMGPWYHNTFDIMREIPFSPEGSVYDCALSRPIEFGIFPDQQKAQFYDRGWRSIPSMFAMQGADFLRWSYLQLSYSDHPKTGLNLRTPRDGRREGWKTWKRSRVVGGTASRSARTR